MALNIFIKMDSIKGESQDAKHKDEIDVLSWSWGLEQSGAISPGPGGGGGAGKVSVHNLAITKHIDIATPQLMLACANGKHIKEALLTVRRPNPNQIEFVRIKMNDVMVSSVSTSGSSDDSIAEDVALNFSKVQIEYVQQKPDGSTGQTSQFKWDFQANKPF
jgi:type VI secretion system secreted protein Hcp